ncbi:hypothetical protein N2152v2_000794 [Parachlorella kessleri]
MVEGHQCHRVAAHHRKLLLGKAFAATSPNYRFIEGAAAVNGKPLTRIEVHGKNLFYFFGDASSPVVVHIHFGMSGAFKTTALPGPEPRETTRLRLVNEELGVVALLSAMTVQHGDLAFYESKASKLGQDPLREDADPEEAWRRVSTSRKPVGLLLMDQSVVAGVGNIYRAEILFKAGIHPEQPGLMLTREAWDTVWQHSVLLLQRGFQTGSILTVDPQEAKTLGKPWTRRYIYNHKRCGRCGSDIRSWGMAGRTAYACETCQPLPPGAELAAGRAKALKAATRAKEFVSHCAPDDPADVAPSKLTLPLLRARLAVLGLPISGRKADLVARLEGALAASGTAGTAEAGGTTGGTAHAAAQAAGSSGLVPVAATANVATGREAEQPAVAAAAVTQLEAAAEEASVELGQAMVAHEGIVTQAVAEAEATESRPPGSRKPRQRAPPRLGRGAKKEAAAGAGAGAEMGSAAAAAEAAGGAPTPSPGPRRGARKSSGRVAAAGSAVPAGPAGEQAARPGEEDGSDEAPLVSPEVYQWGQPGTGTDDAAHLPETPGKDGASAKQQEEEPQGQQEQQQQPPKGAKKRRGPGTPAAASKRGRSTAAPGTLAAGPMATAEEAALEKLLAGEGRNVEHVALQTDETLGLTPPPQRQLRRQARKAGPTGGPSGGQR